MKILFLAPTVTENNAMRAIVLAMPLKTEHEVCVAGPSIHGKPILMEEPGILFERIEETSLLGKVMHASRVMKDYDVLIASDGRLYSALTGCIARLRGKRFVFDTGEEQIASHQFELKKKKGLGKFKERGGLMISRLTFFLRRFAHQTVVATSILKEKFGGDVFPIPVDVDFFSQGDGSEIKQQYNGPIVLHLGSVQRHKGIELLVEAFEIASTAIPNTTFVFIGSLSGSPLFAEEMKTAASHSNANILFLGESENNEETRNWLAAADCLAIVSEDNPIHNAQFPIKAAIALAAGKPIVATDVGCIKDIVVDCAIVTQPQATAIAKDIVSVLDDIEMSKKLADCARRRATSHYSYGAVKQQMTALYLGITQ